MAKSVNLSINRDLEQLETMLANYDKLAVKLDDPKLSHPDRQILHASLDMLKEIMQDKTRDIKRRLREVRKY